MFSHVTVGTSDVDRATVFYEAVLAPLGLVLRKHEAQWVNFKRPGEPFPFFTALLPLDDAAPSGGNGAMVAFLASDRASVDAAYAAAIKSGAVCEGPPGPRPHYHAHYYGAYFRDPDGNKIHVVCHEASDDV